MYNSISDCIRKAAGDEWEKLCQILSKTRKVHLNIVMVAQSTGSEILDGEVTVHSVKDHLVEFGAGGAKIFMWRSPNITIKGQRISVENKSVHYTMVFSGNMEQIFKELK